MVGANTLLGEILRVALPKLARETGRRWMLAPSSETYPGADANDPLKDHDDPAADAKDGETIHPIMDGLLWSTDHLYQAHVNAFISWTSRGMKFSDIFGGVP
jgi:hypothetical protein